jgi:putative N6-adenine-specific DNA methylase
VYDPCCGSGTLLIEAGLMASKTPPGFLRPIWGFMLLPEYSLEAWLKVKAEADAKRVELPKRHLFGTDINKQAIHASRTNVRAAGLNQVVEIIHHDFRTFKPSVAPNFVITNPPHGLRLDDVEKLRGFYRLLGDFMKRETIKPARGFIFTSSSVLAKEVGLAASRRHVVENSGIDSRLLEFDLY